MSDIRLMEYVEADVGISRRIVSPLNCREEDADTVLQEARVKESMKWNIFRDCYVNCKDETCKIGCSGESA